MKKLLIILAIFNIIAFNVKTVEAQNKTDKKVFTLPLGADTVMLFGSQDIEVTNLSIDVTMLNIDTLMYMHLYHGNERAASTHKPMIDYGGSAIVQTLDNAVSKYLIYTEYFEGTFGHLKLKEPSDTTGTITVIVTYK